MDMGRQRPTEITVECRLHAAVDGPLDRVLHLDSAPHAIRIHDDATGLVARYRRVGVCERTAWYVFDALA